MEQSSGKNINIKQWAEADRPREKLLALGRRSLSDAELIAILIGSGSRDESAVSLGKRILLGVGNDLNALARLSLADLCKFKGIGEAKAITIIAAMELGRRRKEQTVERKPKITSSNDAYMALKHLYEDLNHEEFWVLLLNNNNQVVGQELISKGGIGMVSIDVRLIFHAAILAKATGIILSHNHPSGSLMPSYQDKNLTKKVVEAAALFGFRVMDHLIFGDQGYCSFGDEGLL
ncbi:RadC family protein [Olivibacter sitiensis]|uniref:RadC family protein n=1 Tax=Olivibacter sitiensis TaxID=376470 RepID=UPI00041F3447|nr:DNA repair protein RadC [Olivibacter sitiensis]